MEGVGLPTPPLAAVPALDPDAPLDP